MAHKNIDERRAYVKELLEKGVDRKEIIELSKIRFGCSHTSIISDIAISNNIKRKSYYKYKPWGTAGFHKRICDRDGKTCQYCKRTNVKMIIEHIVPISRGGKYIDENMVVACNHCNYVKKNKIWIPNNFIEISKDNPDFQNYVLTKAVRDFRKRKRVIDKKYLIKKE